MKVKVLLFGAIADAVGSRELELAINESASAESLANALSRKHTGLAKETLLFAVNEEHAAPDTVLNDGDEIAIFTAVSGG